MFVVTHFDKHDTKEWLTLGKFTSADEAARCYDRHVRATDGTKAKLNFPEQDSAPPKIGGFVVYVASRNQLFTDSARVWTSQS